MPVDTMRASIYKPPVSPLKVLREFLSQNKELKPLSTQYGLSGLINRSESLVRAIENGRTPMNPKLASFMSTKIGVSAEWLMEADVDGKEIPSTAGGPLKHMDVLDRIEQEISTNLSKVSRTIEPKNPAQARMADAIAKLVADEILEYLERGEAPSENGEENPVTFILEWLSGRARKRANS